MPPLLGQFQGEVLDWPVEVRIYESHVEVFMSYRDEGISVVVDMDEIGRVEVEEILGMPVLVIEDRWGISVASVKMDRMRALRAKTLVERARRA